MENIRVNIDRSQWGLAVLFQVQEGVKITEYML